MNERLLQLLEEHRHTYLSGTEISARLQISRSAVWKQVEQLRKQGYEFSAVPRRGYRMLEKPQALRLQPLIKQLQTKRMAKGIFYNKKLDSTQSEAKRLLEQDAPEGTLILAEEQTLGRGRQGRSWYSPAGKGLWLSQILKPDIPIHFTPQLTLLTAVALCRTIRSLLALHAGIKWPNDILIDGKKISGILLESGAEDERLKYVIAGVGISVNVQREDYPQEIADKASSLRAEMGAPIDREQLLLAFLQEWDWIYADYLQNGFALTKSLWESYSVSLQQKITVPTRKGSITGVAIGLDPFGGLLLKLQDGSIETVHSAASHE